MVDSYRGPPSQAKQVWEESVKDSGFKTMPVPRKQPSPSDPKLGHHESNHSESNYDNDDFESVSMSQSLKPGQYFQSNQQKPVVKSQDPFVGNGLQSLKAQNQPL